jgi:hypothetical protein
MDYVVNDWGTFVGILGLAASVGGLVFAFLARRAAKSAEQAAREARRAITRTLSVVDIGRAVALIGRLKEVHRQRNWDYALGLYAGTAKDAERDWRKHTGEFYPIRRLYQQRHSPSDRFGESGQTVPV